MADRWPPQEMYRRYDDYVRDFERIFSPDLPVPAGWKPDFPVEHTVIDDYVWLPFCFEGEMGNLNWRDVWRIEEFE